MYRQLDIGLNHLNRQLVSMAGYVEAAIDASIQAWKTRNLTKVYDVYEIEKKVNAAHVNVDDLCVKLLALQQPLAADLRLIVAITKINSDLERMVDLAVNIGNNTEYYLKTPPKIPVEDLALASDEVRVMVKEVLDAFVRMDEELARSVLVRDDKVDALKRKVVNEAIRYMKEDPSLIDQGINVIFIAKNLERMGDHATNIAEDVIYTLSGRDIRHKSRSAWLKEEKHV